MADDEIADDIEEIENVTRCPGCNTRQAHDILKEKELKDGTGVDYLLRCSGCGNVHTMVFRSPKAIIVKFTLSDGPSSKHYQMEIDEDEVFTIGDEFDAENMLWRITRLEIDGDDRPTETEAKEVKMVWAMRIDLARIKRTFSDGGKSFADVIEVDPDRVFTCGTVVKHRGTVWKIRALHSGVGRILNGKMTARDIRRIFLHRPPTPEEIEDKKIRDRGNWKGQEFPGREEHQRKWRDE
ncbi:MAG: HVO_0476 family zinc finger protein [Candidatus Thalassarchaeaceae archaeon]|jgi:uncharacterized Zn finger protein|nr:HVO_0476 family zinc finger protein [Candidatus Thalassarchaeaceae archaeon]